MSLKKHKLLIFFIFTAIFFLFVDFASYGTIDSSLLYTAMMVLALKLEERRHILILAVFCGMCAIIGLASTKLHSVSYAELEYRILALLMQFIVSYLVIHQKVIISTNEENERNLRFLHDNNPSMYFSVDQHGKIIFVNDYGAQQLGYSKSELTNCSVFDVFEKEDVDGVRRQLDICLSEPDQTHQWEIRKIKKDGQKIWVRETARCTRQSSGRKLIQIVCEDITKQKFAINALIEQEALMRSVFEEAPVGFTLKSPELKYVDLNKAFCEMLGYEKNALLDMYCTEITHPDDIDIDSGFINKLLGGQLSSYTRTKRYLTIKGKTIWVKIYSSLIFDEKNKNKYIVSIVENINEQKQVEDKLFQKNRAMKALIASNDAIIHERDFNKLIKNICRVIVDYGDYKMAWVGFKQHDDEKSIKVTEHAGYEDGYLSTIKLSWSDDKYGAGPAGSAIRSMNTCVFRDISQNKDFAPWKNKALERGYMSVAGFPIMHKDEAIGVLTIYAPDVNAFQHDELRLLENLSSNLTYAVNTFQLRGKRRQAETLLSLEKESLELITKNFKLEETLETLLCKIEGYLSDVKCSILFVDQSKQTLTGCISTSLPAGYNAAVNGVSIGPHNGSCGTAAYRNESVIVSDTFADPLWNEFRELAEQYNLRACWSIPIRSTRDQSVIATFANYYDHVREPSAEELEVIGRMCGIVEIAINDKNNEEELLASKARYKSIIEVTRVVPWEMNLDTLEATYIGPHVAAVFGFPASNWLKHGFWLSILHPDDKDYVINIFEKNILSYERYDLKYRIYDAEKNTRWIRDISQVTYSDDGKQLLRGIMVDITDSIETEEQLLQAQKMDALGKLTGGIAHDFNNLLTVIKGNLELIEEQTELDDKYEQYFKTVLRDCITAANDAESLNEQLLAYSRKQHLSPSKIEVNTFIDNWIRLLPRVIGNNIKIKTRFGNLKKCGWFDPVQFETALLNLVLNARDAMTGAGTLTIETKQLFVDSSMATNTHINQGDYIYISVTDTGKGMSDDVIRHAFEPFFTTKEIGKGSGLGLSMVQGFIKQSGGSIEIQSTRNQGAKISILLPAIHEKNSESDIDTITDRAVVLGGDEAILVVEDDAQVRAFSCRALESLGYRVLQAENAEEAMQLLNENNSISLVFSDNILPGELKGRELAAYIEEHHPDVKVLLTTGYSKDQGEEASIYDGKFPFLKKPFTKMQLGQVVRMELDNVLHQ